MTNASYMQDRRKKHLAKAKEVLGGKCIECGTTERLQFHHVNNTEKLFNISSGADCSDRRFFTEVAKCVLLCISCHGIETGKNRSITHGLYATYAAGGCRCDDCKAAKRDYEWFKKHRLIDV